MKNLLFSILFVTMCCIKISAQIVPDSISFDENGEFSLVVLTKANAQQIFQYSRAFFAARDKVHKTWLVTEDAEACKIQVSTSHIGDDFMIKIKTGELYNKFTSERFLMTIIGKDGRFRVKVENPTYEYDVYMKGMKKLSHEKDKAFKFHIGMGAEYGEYKDLLARVNHNRRIRFSKLINELLTYIDKQIADEDF